jgi:hypothetical protein
MLERIRWPHAWAAAAALWVIVWLGFFLWARHNPSVNWLRELPAFDRGEEFAGPSAEGQITKDLAVCLALLMALNTAGFFLLQFRSRLRRLKLGQRTQSFVAATPIFFALAYCEIFNNPQHLWYDIPTMMSRPASVPIFGQRLLFVWPAMLLKHLVPKLTYFQAFVALQLVALALAIYLIGEWSEIFIGRPLSFLGQLMLGVMLLPTFGYINGHDFGVVASYTLCFLLLYKRRYWFYGMVFCIGMLNHQNILLLIPTAFNIMWRREKRQCVAWVAALTIVAYFSIRYLLNYAIPIPQTHDYKIWFNIHALGEASQNLAFGQLVLISWCTVAAMAWSKADAFLKRASILLPLQYGVYFLYGQLDEVRLFNGLLPVIIGMCLCYVRCHLQPGESVPDSGCREAAGSRAFGPFHDARSG